LLASRHVVVKAATDAGKTLAIMLLLFLSPNKMVITVTQLKLLQKDHVRLIIRTLHYIFLGLCRSMSFFGLVSHPSPSTMIKHTAGEAQTGKKKKLLIWEEYCQREWKTATANFWTPCFTCHATPRSTSLPVAINLKHLKTQTQADWLRVYSRSPSRWDRHNVAFHANLQGWLSPRLEEER
jgi:hypothetical protein